MIYFILIFVSFAVHQNYVGADVEKSLYFISVVLTDANNHNVPQYRAILWRKTVSKTSNMPQQVFALWLVERLRIFNEEN